MKNSSISWTHHTFNPWIGCTRVSPGCLNSYADTLNKRWGKDLWGKDKARQRTSAANWKQPIAWDKEAQKLGERRRVFCASMTDVFDAEVRDDWRMDLFSLISQTPNLDWLILTKRIDLALFWSIKSPRVWENIWLGISVEDQCRADERIALLNDSAARIRLLSCEPLLEPIDLGNICFSKIDWVIVRGESGPNCRPMNIEWARDLRDQCLAANIPFFFKQVGGFPDKRERLEQFPEDLRIQEFPK